MLPAGSCAVPDIPTALWAGTPDWILPPATVSTVNCAQPGMAASRANGSSVRNSNSLFINMAYQRSAVHGNFEASIGRLVADYFFGDAGASDFRNFSSAA